MICLPLTAEQRRTRKGEILCVLETRTHVFGQRLVLSAVCLVDDHDDVTARRQLGIRLSSRPTEFLDECKDQSPIFAEEFPHLLAIRRLCRISLRNRASPQEVPVNLPVQVFAVGYNHEREVASLLAKDFSDVKDHRETLAGTLGMPEHSELALQFFPPEKSFIGTVNPDELMVLSNDLLVVFVEKNEVLNIVQQSLWG